MSLWLALEDAIDSTMATSRSAFSALQTSPLASRNRTVSKKAARLFPSGSGWFWANRATNTAAWVEMPTYAEAPTEFCE